MLDQLIRLSLSHRLVVVTLAALLLGWGGFVLTQLPIDVFPDLNRATVTVMTEAGGLSPEEVEALVTRPIELALNGVAGVQRVRSTSGIGLSIVAVEFGWDVDVWRARQLVSERLASARERLPREASPQMAPVASVMGEIMLLGLSSRHGETSPAALRETADWVIRPRLLELPGIAQVTTLGGGVRQLQVLVDPRKLLAYELSLDDVERAAGLAQASTSGGFLEHKGQEYLVRNLARTADPEELAETPVAWRGGVAVPLRAVATVQSGVGVRRGDGGMNGAPAIILAVQKQPGTDTLSLTEQVKASLATLQKTLPADIEVRPLFEQARFIRAAVSNVAMALRDGALLVVLVLVVFLLNARTTAITLTAIPLSFVVAALTLKAFGISLNTMTLGGLAVAVGELVDDAIVDVENVYRRLRENAQASVPQPSLHVIWRASSEVRGSIVHATALVVLVFLPLFSLSGVEGRLFAPLAVAYVTSVLASLLVSLTVTPALCALLFRRPEQLKERADGALVRWLKAKQTRLLSLTLERPLPILAGAALMVALAVASVPLLGTELLPPFNEGTATLTVIARPGTSLEESNHIGRLCEQLLLEIPEVATVGRRTGRAEQDDHAEGVHYTELDVDFKEKGRPREKVLEDMRARLSQVPGVALNVGQPISHRLDHLLSGVRAQVVVKVFGADLAALRTSARRVNLALAGVPGLVDLQVEQQTLVPQARVRVNREQSARYGVSPGALAELLSTALHGRAVGQVLEEERTFDVVVRYAEDARVDLDAVRAMLVDTPSGAKVPLAALADVEDGLGPNAIAHDGGQRRIAIFANVSGRDLSGVVADVQRRLDALELSPGQRVALEGQFQSQQSATRTLALLSVVSLSAIVMLLWLHFRSLRLVAQVLLNIPLALVGSVAAIWLTERTLSVATVVGFIALCGIASRNTIMMISHYLHLVEHEGEKLDRGMVVRGSLERLVPVLMTALTAGLALVPLALSRGEPGKEILWPVAVVILGGLTSSTLLDLVVTPTLFLRFGGPGLERYLAARKPEDAERLVAASPAAPLGETP